ncbi:hypothetical protein ASC97_28550 [Rhizobium sp. Root1203]|uniref:elongation factor G n=1 Tax=Rhizobium sp. Root1203 TaxID=1736427 RepID=UPI0007093760|nr:TetM/TetW/TetO/TetS family tetracycline resistance ribosomal protection protein [Rhizobium sp. Root1203]KQV20789.1 hypothetical protein ASC97_28550 [Rhizobium sp. Root1203]
MRTLNLGILAHVDAGKTSLTERLLFHAGVIKTMGGVDTGDTQTDTLQLERERGITIKAAVASFVFNDTRVNLLDTPGHPDFIAEVERVLGILDGAVLVVSAVEGVQAQTRVLMRALARLKVPTIVFVNKIDRRGADDRHALANLRSRLSDAIVPMGYATAPGTPDAAFVAFSWKDRQFRSAVLEALAEHDDRLLEAFADDADVPGGTLSAALAMQTAAGSVHPVFFGSAITGSGIGELMNGVTALLPAPVPETDRPASAAVFKVERTGAGEKLAYLRMFAGSVRVRDRLSIAGKDNRITEIEVFSQGQAGRRDLARAGDIAKVRGLSDVRIGDWIGERSVYVQRQFSPPMLESVVVPSDPTEAPLLWKALLQMTEQDPLINLRQGDGGQDAISISLYGEVQKEVIEHTLRVDYGLEVHFLETSPIYIERVVGTGRAVDHAPDPFVATVGLIVEPGDCQGRHRFRSLIDPGSLPFFALKAVEEAVEETLKQGVFGWQVTDCVVSLVEATRMRKWASSTPADHRHLTPLVLAAALEAAGTEVCEPMDRISIEMPPEALPGVQSLLARLGASLEPPTSNGSILVLGGTIAAISVHSLQRALPSLTGGLGTMDAEFFGYRALNGPPPVRKHAGPNHFSRSEYLARLRGARQS